MIDFHEIYNRYAGDIYRFALFLCKDPEEAKEISAETFARALTGKTPLVSVTVKGYLLTIARNLYYESLRSRKKHGELPPELPDMRPQVEDVIMQKMELEELRIYLQTFPEEDRSTLLLRADGMAYSEIAQVLTISVASAKVKVHRLRLKLAEWRANRELKEQ
ncbi:MAG: sigma-70 family RNA polymerase sigma factor [Bacteroidia bacterium]|nr:sigma-70 family RNA polymerase sigma factor [Bacteroidia bacterium]